MFIVEWFIGVLTKYPEAAVYLSVGLGFIVGRIKIGFFSLGTVASALLIGLLVGQLGITVPGPMRSAFFMLFLFTTGYAVGPQFFQSIAKNGIKQVLFALCVCFMCFISVFLLAKLAGYNVGEAGGLYAGSQTISGALGIVPETIASNPNFTQEQKDYLISFVPVCYSITYIFGAAGSAFILGIVGPRLLGGLDHVKAEVKELEHEMGDQNITEANPAVINALRPVAFRSYHVTNPWFTTEGRKVSELEFKLLSMEDRIFVTRIRHQNMISYPTKETLIYPEDDLVISGRREYVMDLGAEIGNEIADYELLNFAAEDLPILVTKNSIAGKKVSQLLAMEYMYGVNLKKINRNGTDLRIRPGLEIMAGDLVEISGLANVVKKAAKEIGLPDRPSNETDIVFLCLGIVAGVFFGSMAIKAGTIPISLGSSGGVLLAGLFLGWMRSKRPSIGLIPTQAVWLMRTIGLSLYVAIIGIAAAPSFGSSIKDIGWGLLVFGALATTIPLLTGIFLGKYVFKFKGPITLGCIAGARTSTPSLGAITDQLNSDLPTIGYSLTYAVGVVINLISALVIVLLMI